MQLALYAPGVDPLARQPVIANYSSLIAPNRAKGAGIDVGQSVSNKPVETFIYTANLAHMPIFVSTPDGMVWRVENGKMKIDRSK